MAVCLSQPARPDGVLLMRRTCASRAFPRPWLAITPDAVSTPWRVYLQQLHDRQLSADQDNLAETTIFSSVPAFLVITNLGDQKTYFGFLAISCLSSIPHLPPPASHLQPTPKMYPSIQLESRPPAKYLVPAQGHPPPDTLFRVPTTLYSTVPVRHHMYQKPLHQATLFQHLQY